MELLTNVHLDHGPIYQISDVYFYRGRILRGCLSVASCYPRIVSYDRWEDVHTFSAGSYMFWGLVPVYPLMPRAPTVTRDWQNGPMTQAEQDAWDEHRESHSPGQHDRAAYFSSPEQRRSPKTQPRAICEALTTQKSLGRNEHAKRL